MRIKIFTLLLSIFIVGNLSAATIFQQDSKDSLDRKYSLYFDFDKDQLNSSQYQTRDNILEWAKANRDNNIVIIGWADPRGTIQWNLDLSTRRAANISNFLIKNGVDQARISYEGKGIDSKKEDYSAARRVDVYEVIEKVVVPMTPLVPAQEEKQEEAANATATAVAAETTTTTTTTETVTQTEETETNNEVEAASYTGAGSAVADDSYFPKGSYAGIRLGVPFAIATQSATDMGKVQPGFSGGLFYGYRFNKLFSVELSAVLGGDKMSNYDSSFYTLDTQGNKHFTYKFEGEGWKYSEISSHIFYQQFGANIKFNVLGLFNRTKDGRVVFNISPGINLINVGADIRENSTGNTVLEKNITGFGINGDVSIDYAITKKCWIGIYSNLSYTFADPIDGMPKHEAGNNHIWDSGLRFGINF